MGICKLSTDELLDVIMWRGKKHGSMLEAMREALLAGDDGRALDRARDLVAFHDVLGATPDEDLLERARSEEAPPADHQDVSSAASEIPIEMQPMSQAQTRGLVDVLIEIGTKREQTQQSMKAALDRDDSAEALRCARELVGLGHLGLIKAEKKSNTSRSRRVKSWLA